MSPYLPDVNVLIALIDPAHVRHESAHNWFAAQGQHAWATCPLTENGVLRIVGHARYPNTPGMPATVADLVAQLRSLPGHQFWADDVSLLDSRYVDSSRLTTSSQVTDTYLLALARVHGGRLATFDRHLVTSAVFGGAESLVTLD